MATKLRVLLWMVVCFAATTVGHGVEVFAADASPARTEKQIETTVVHVDKYGVYAPNLIFYWDPGMNKQKVATLTGMAEQLRNKDGGDHLFNRFRYHQRPAASPH